MANTVLTVLSMTIGFFFILIGSLKIAPALNDEVYREMRKVFIRHAKVFPFQELTGWKPNAQSLRKFVGTTEVVCGVILVMIPGSLKEIANVILFFIMTGAVYGHFMLKEGMDKMTPALVFSLLLACRFIVHLQVKAREQRQLRELERAEAALSAAESKKSK
ncbi:hypothetical protein CAPTEDRAFT_181278 [Capitella teleta]|uniref:Novel acetylcholine receptor chaperone n=1 Tax=Capitella teleta TaxID=283909 RepID=R7UHH4_CAPTE|nr:hypothetical protein CAPTEDRAFT_181278 [Capitella teleta]|eukprot:ELU03263.1 hypothetical protein CAPTEDRAFT_181278 [Capitella teleta]